MILKFSMSGSGTTSGVRCPSFGIVAKPMNEYMLWKLCTSEYFPRTNTMLGINGASTLFGFDAYFLIT